MKICPTNLLPHLAVLLLASLLTVVAPAAARPAANDGALGVTRSTSEFIEPDNATGTSKAVVVNENAALAFSGEALPLERHRKIVGSMDVARQADQVLQNLDKTLNGAGSDLRRADLVQLKAFLQPMSEVESVRREIIRFFDGHAPPVVFVEWISAPPNPPIEIELIAAAKGDFSKEADAVSFITPPGTTDSKAFKRAARVNHGKQIFVSGLYGLKSTDGAGQVREIFDSRGEVLKQTGSDFKHLVKATYYVTDNDASDKRNDIRPAFYNPQRPPAASKPGVKGVGLTGKTVAMAMIVVTK